MYKEKLHTEKSYTRRGVPHRRRYIRRGIHRENSYARRGITREEELRMESHEVHREVTHGEEFA